MKIMRTFEEHSNNKKEWSVICKWVENKKDEWDINEWDIIANGPLTYDEATEIAKNAGYTWDKNAPKNEPKITHTEVIIKYDKLQKMIQEENLLAEYKEELLNISVAPHELSKSEFKDYIRDYTSNPEEYNIDLDSNYGKALLWAIDNIDKAYDLIN